MSGTKTAVPTRVTTAHRINADPRVIASRDSFEAFLASEAGARLSEAANGHDHRAKMGQVAEDIKTAYEAHAVNHTITRRRVRLQLQGVKPLPSYTELLSQL